MTAITPQEAEFYPTPAWCVHRLLEAVTLPKGCWVEPCVGEGAILDAVDSRLPMPEGERHWMCADIRSTSCAVNVVDYLTTKWARAQVCIMNPPFSKALAFAQRATAHCDVVVMLQRLNWLASEDRADWIRDNTPSVYVLPNRPSFTGDGRTDGQDYAWFVWDGEPATVTILQSTPSSERSERYAARPKAQQDLGL